MVTKQEFSAYVLVVLQQAEEELVRRQAGFDGPGTVQELEQSVNELSDLVERLEMGQLPPISKRELVSAWFALHTWPTQDQLGERICRISQIYKHLIDEPGLPDKLSVSKKHDKLTEGGTNNLTSRAVSAIQGKKEV